MKIGDPTNTGIGGLGGTQSGSPASRSAAAHQGAKQRGDRVQLSNLSGALGADQSNSPARAGRLAQLSGAVGSGTYQVDAQALSSRIIQSSTRN